MKIILSVTLLCVSGTVLAIDTAHRLTQEQWSVPRNPESVVAMPALSRAMQDFQATANARLRIHHPGGDRGNLWAAELRAWLITLGVPSTDLEMSAGSANMNVIELEVVSGGNKTPPVMTILPEERVE
ncbi:MAG: hypothetical protein RI563_06890 [Thiohalophilus sp.]|uniref:hypothetical protein n=1 Tax=Thiohalophilus sp. TaxID=3028392 RepID=UPI00286FC710|nr:hypothetical protein [Thiohalophilus sp.]MDR9436589.1 hypothetical protein [Thiohalophilus sp.]